MQPVVAQGENAEQASHPALLSWSWTAERAIFPTIYYASSRQCCTLSFLPTRLLKTPQMQTIHLGACRHTAVNGP
jgi:hypothetical protein